MPGILPSPRSNYTAQGRKRAGYEIVTRYGGIGHADPEPVREHLLGLIAVGLSARSLARDAEVGMTCVHNVLNLRNERISIRQAKALMAVSWYPNPRQGNVLALGAARRLRALHAIGWTWYLIADHAGVPESQLSKIARPTTTRKAISWEWWNAINLTYEALSGTPNTAGRANAARLHAQRNDWAAPLDWEGHNIDDPHASVEAQPYEPKSRIDEIREAAAVRAERVAELTALGLSAKEVAQRVGITPRQVVRDRGATAVAAA